MSETVDPLWAQQVERGSVDIGNSNGVDLRREEQLRMVQMDDRAGRARVIDSSGLV